MPVFGTGAIRDMFPAMEDVVSQLVTKWERFASFVQSFQARAKTPAHRFGPDYVIDTTKDYTKLTLDAISLASMSYRMNSFYTVGQTLVSSQLVLTRSLGRSGALHSRANWSSRRVPTTSYAPAHRNSSDDSHSSTVRHRH